MRSDHPSDTKSGGKYMFYKDHLAVIRHDNLCVLKECIVTECCCCQNCHLTLSNTDDTSLFCSIVIGNFNARCRNWWAGDINSNAGKELDHLTFRIYSLINKPTHFFSGGTSGIDLIFCNKLERVRMRNKPFCFPNMPS